MKKAFLGAVVVAGLLAGPAVAADMAVKARPLPMVAMYDWSGFYIGGNAGGGWSRKCWDLYADGFARARVNLNPSVPEGCHDATGGVAGGQVGYRWQRSSWVFGLEAQGDWADLRGQNLSLVFNALNKTKIDSFGLFTGQIGYAWNNVLLYLKGGAAVVNDKYQGLNATTLALVDAASETRWGGVVGVGLEYGFTPNWSAALEYDHMFMGARNIELTNVNTGAFSRGERIRQDVDLFTVRVNYRFGGPIVAKY